MRNSFNISAEVNGADIELVNRELKRLATPYATEAMKAGFRKYTTRVAKVAKTLAPFGNAAASEKVRGVERPNPHIRNHITTKVRGYSQGKVVWAAVGVKEKRGSYETPHWYLRWVEFGHKIRRKATAEEQLRAKTRGATKKKEYGFTTIGSVKGSLFLRRASQMAAPYLLNDIQDAVAKVILKYWGRRG